MSLMHAAPLPAAPVSEEDGRNFRLAMREFASSVTIVSTGEGAARNGCTATAVSSLSLTPPSILVCLQSSSSTLASIRKCGSFCVNFLSSSHRALAERFAGKGGAQGSERFAEGDWAPLLTGVPALSNAAAVVDCRVDEILERHNHSILIGVVAAVRVDGSSPALLHWRSRFETLS